MPTIFARAVLVALILRSCTCSNGDGVEDPCLTSNGGCDPHAVCTNNNGTAACDCKTGYEGDGKTCLRDPCLVMNGGCDVNADCQNMQGAAACTCKRGFRGDGMVCLDLDECGDGTAHCDPNAHCTDSLGSYTCACKTGWVGDGTVCKLDPCATNNGGCDSHAKCQSSSDGTALCTCETGWLGDGQVCTPDCRLPGNGCTASGTLCNGYTGMCAPDCSLVPCSSNQACLIDNTQSPIGMECVPECSSNADCASGFACDTQAQGQGHACVPIHGYAGTCGPNVGACGTLTCVFFDMDDLIGECLPKCTINTENSDCAAYGAQCSVTLSDMTKICNPPLCGNDGGTVCASSTSCRPVRGTVNPQYCLPNQR